MSPNNMGVFCCAGGLVLLLKIASVNHQKAEISFDDYKDVKRLVSIHPELQQQVAGFLVNNKITHEDLGKLEDEAENLQRSRVKREFRSEYAKATGTRVAYQVSR